MATTDQSTATSARGPDRAPRGSNKQTQNESTQTESTRLEDQAAIAALYVTKSEREMHEREAASNEKNHKLSAASAAASLHYANPKDLPSFPVLGLADGNSSAGAAASLANAHQKPFQHWKPDPSASASAAAVLAKDYKPADIWHPQQSTAGSRAALLAHKEGASVNIWKPGNTEYGSSAAALAFRSGSTLGPKAETGLTADNKSRSLQAATGAMSGSRRRAGSTPVHVSTYPDSVNSAANALNAATVANKPSTRRGGQNELKSPQSPAFDAARIHNIAKSNISREMYTSHPPVAIEVEERKRADTLHAAAVVMARQMYTIQQKAVEDAAGPFNRDSHHAANTVHSRRLSESSDEDAGPAPMRFNSLQEAAQKLASERLAKLHDEHAAYRNYYGATPPAKRSSLRLTTRRRASSEGNKFNDDEEQSRRIRSQMSVFNNKIAEVDSKKRQKDRDALMAAAQRNVQQRMSGMDEQVFAKTGKMTPGMMEEWEAKARAAAESDSKARMVNHGKVNIGGGRYLDQSEIDAVAARIVQPVLDDINERAEKERARQEEIRLDREQAQRQASSEKAREKEVKADLKRAKEREKAEARTKKEEEKSKQADEKRLAKEEKLRSKTTGKEEIPVEEHKEDEEAVAVHKAPQSPDSLASPISTYTDQAVSPEPESSAAAAAAAPRSEPLVVPTSPRASTADEGRASPSSPGADPTSPKADSKVKSWLKGRFSRSGKPSKSEESESRGSEEKGKGKATFSGGAALTGSGAANTSQTSLEGGRDSMREVAMAGRQGSPPTDDERRSRSRKRRGDPSPSPSISPASSPHSGDRDVSEDFEEARDTFDPALAPPPAFESSSTRKSDSPVRDSRFSEML
ncbi:MAG: hypothetical protein M4579_000875 [Chaenotheca gracillima]|nr:MAG: hypothetical protein M4579_000875 [Chaenotheca gracillima]